LTALLVFYFANSNGFSSTKLVLVGAAISAIFSGLTSLIIAVTPNERAIRGALFWMSGSLAGSTWQYIPFLFISLLIVFILVYPKYDELNILVTGDENATSLGVDVKKIRFLIMITSTFLTGIVVANTGIVGFVGLVIPHITRGLVGGNHKKVIPIAILLGAVFLVLTDTLTRTLVSSQEIPIGVITSVLGAPFFLSMLRRKSYRFGGE
jgi:hemin transport system permease hmuU